MPKNDQFLIQHFIECQNTMRHRVDTELKHLKTFLILNPIIITATVGTKEFVSDKIIFLIFSFSMALFLTALATFLTIQIIAGHEKYETIGQEVVKIWEYFGLFEKGAYIENDSIILKKHLFNLSFEFKEHMKEGQISDELMQIFEKNNLSLSTKAIILKIDEKKWRILDECKPYKEPKEYGIEDYDKQLIIYDEKSKTYGKGIGYFWTLCILWSITIMADTSLILIGVL